MSWNLSKGKPIYLQLIELITLQILSGKYGCGEHFPTVRELASEAAVNPNTMQKALAQLEQMGLLSTSRTNGRTVTTDQSMLERMREEKARHLYENFLRSMSELGFSGEETKNFLIANCDEITEESDVPEESSDSPEESTDLTDTSENLAERGIYDSTTGEQPQ